MLSLQPLPVVLARVAVEPFDHMSSFSCYWFVNLPTLQAVHERERLCHSLKHLSCKTRKVALIGRTKMLIIKGCILMQGNSGRACFALWKEAVVGAL